MILHIWPPAYPSKYQHGSLFFVLALLGEEFFHVYVLREENRFMFFGTFFVLGAWGSEDYRDSSDSQYSRDSRDYIERELTTLDADRRRKVVCENAGCLYGFI